VGGGISFGTTYFFHRSERRENTINHSWALYLGLMQVINDVFSVSSRYYEALGDNQWVLHPWRVIPEIIGHQNADFQIPAEQLSTISGKHAKGLASDILELVNLRNTILNSVKELSDMKNAFLQSVAHRSDLGPGMEISTLVSPDADPELIIQARSLDSLTRQVLTNMLAFEERQSSISHKYNRFTSNHPIKTIRGFRAQFTRARPWQSDLPLIESSEHAEI